MRNLSKTLLGVAGAAVAATSLAAPAEAQRYRRYDDRYYGRDRGVDAGDVIAGIAIVGGVAALISALDGGGRYGRYDDRYSRNRSRGGTARQAVDACARAARQEARYDGDRARVGQIENVERAGNGYYRVYGTLAVQDRDFLLPRDRLAGGRAGQAHLLGAGTERTRVRDRHEGAKEPDVSRFLHPTLQISAPVTREPRGPYSPIAYLHTPMRHPSTPTSAGPQAVAG